jgi:hypothetical protein
MSKLEKIEMKLEKIKQELKEMYSKELELHGCKALGRMIGIDATYLGRLKSKGGFEAYLTALKKIEKNRKNYKKRVDKIIY